MRDGDETLGERPSLPPHSLPLYSSLLIISPINSPSQVKLLLTVVTLWDMLPPL